jgi:hypothetical protein
MTLFQASLFLPTHLHPIYAACSLRISDDRTIKTVFLRKLGGKRKVGRPKLRWLDCIENDLKFVGVKRWRKKAEDRSAWAITLKEVMVKIQRP